LNNFSPKFNSIDYSISFFLPNSIQKLIQDFEIGCIQFNKIFIQLGNAGIDQGYLSLVTKAFKNNCSADFSGLYTSL